MFLSWISRLCATLLVPILFVVTVGFVLSQTVFNAPYIKEKFQHLDTYSKISKTISAQVAKDPKYSALPTDLVQSQIETVVTPTALESKVNTTIDQYVAYVNGNGPAPTLDLSSFVLQAQSAGLPTPSDPKLQQPIAVPGADEAKKVKDAVRTGLIIGVVGTVLLIAIMLAIATVRRNFKPISYLLISLGIVVLLAGLGLYFIPSVLNDLVKIGTADFGLNTGRDLAMAIARDIGKRLLIIGAVYEVVGVVSRIIFGIFAKRNNRPTAIPPQDPSSPQPIEREVPAAPAARPPQGPTEPTRKIQL